MNKKKVLLITQNFPLGYKEQFLEHEVPLWLESNDVELSIAPVFEADGVRDEYCDYLDTRFVVSNRLSYKLLLSDVYMLLKDYSFIKEFVKCIFSKDRFLKVRTLLIWSMFSNRIFSALNKNAEYVNEFDTVYVYWSHWMLMGVLKFKLKNKSSFRLISRAHRVDLYDYALPVNYMPYNYKYAQNVDKIYSVSKDGASYIVNNYGISPDKVEVSMLGVPACKPENSLIKVDQNIIKIVSVSYIKKVKRLDRIIEAIAIIKKITTKKVVWHHIGSGDAEEYIKNLAAEKNIDCNWHGLKPNVYVKNFLSENTDAIFINVSESEGIPVSIMEAMSFGIKVIATDVGGTSELVDSKVGFLLSENPSYREVADSIIMVNKKNISTKAVYRQFEKLASVQNYRNFIADCLRD